MRKCFIASIFLFIFCAFAFGQKSNCPTISVEEKSEAKRGRTEIIFSASIKGYTSGKIEYFWTTSDGTIVNGQGTDTIAVRANPNTNEFTPTVTVDVAGLPDECQASDTDTATIMCASIISEVDNFEITTTPIDAERLKAVVSEMEKDETATVSVIIYNKGKSPSKSVRETEAFIRKYLSDEKIADDRIGIVYAPESDTDAVHIFIVPEGATPPTP